MIKLTPKAFAVLRYFVDRPGQLVSKQALFEAIWPQTYVSDIALSVCIREIRKAFNDDAKNPRFIETVHRRGYRFVARLIPAAPVPSPAFRVLNPFSTAISHTVGRAAELEQLQGWFEKTVQGERHIVFVAGEAGIGKTTLVETFMRMVESSTAVWIGLGQCVQQYGAGEAYLPVFEALGRLCRLSEGRQLISCLEQYAPSWLAQMPGLLQAEERQQVQQRTAGATQERMLREMAEALEAFTAQRAVILFLEDLHWSDTATLSLVSLLARRRESARLLVIGSYRPGDVLMDKHPLQSLIQELQLHGDCQELPVSGLSLSAVEAYCGQRLGERLSNVSADTSTLARTLHARTAGNPLFLAALTDALLRGELTLEMAGQVRTQGNTARPSSSPVPEVIRHIIERDIDRLDADEQLLLEAASVAGVEFFAASVAAGAEKAEDDVEQQCAALARRLQFIRQLAPSPDAEWPDGTLTTRYHFAHAIYQDVWYARIPAARRAVLHRRIGEREEQGYQDQAHTHAAQLAMHFERGRALERAVFYHQKAGENALRRSAHQEAIIHLTAGLSLLDALPDSRERGAQELALQNAVSIPLLALKGYGAPEAEDAYTRALVLCQQVGETPLLFPVLGGLLTVYHMRGELQRAWKLSEQMQSIACRTGSRVQQLWAHLLQGDLYYNRGNLTAAKSHLELSFAVYDPDQHSPRESNGRNDPGIACLASLASTLWLLGYPDQACASMQQTLRLAEQLGDPFSQSFAYVAATAFHLRCREAEETRKWAVRLIALAREHGFSMRIASGMIYYGWALAEQGEVAEGIAQLEQGLHAIQQTGAELGRPFYLALLAEAYAKAERILDGLSTIDEGLAIAEKNGDRFYEAELYRLRGEGLLAQADQKAEVAFQQAIDIAREQQAKSFELRAMMSLSRLWHQQGKKTEAHQLLSEIYSWFSEGFETKDLQEAKALLHHAA